MWLKARWSGIMSATSTVRHQPSEVPRPRYAGLTRRTAAAANDSAFVAKVLEQTVVQA